MLRLSASASWPYVGGVPCGPAAHLPGRLPRGLRARLPCGSCVSCGSRALTAVGMSVDGVDPRADRLWGLATPTGYRPLCGARPLGVGFTPGARVPVETTLRVCRCGAGQVVLRGGLTPASGRAGSVAPGEGLPRRPRSATGFDCSGLPGGCEGLRALLPPVLDQEASGRGHARSRGWGGSAKRPVRFKARGCLPSA